MNKRGIAAALLLSVTGCSPAPSGGDGAADSGTLDARDSASIDASVPRDILVPDSQRTDAPPGDGAVPPGCNPASGIECDGDWADRCTPACDAGACCAPRHGAFECVPRDGAGLCPAADLWVDASHINGRYRIENQYFEPGNCAVMEGCVERAGWRRLLRFDTWTPNTGTADMYLGVPTRSSPHFEFGTCHGHYHFNSYAQYRLENTDGSIAARGHKQAFCLLDLTRYDAPATASAHYTCGNQGIQMGFQDVYGSGLDCQWVDITDVAPGSYNLHVDINVEHVLNELDYTNNTATVPITVPPGEIPDGGPPMTDAGGGADVVREDVPPPVTDPLMACSTVTMGADRNCGFVMEGTYTCTPGVTVEAGCSARCGIGSCIGDTVMRVCAGSGSCSNTAALGSNNNSGCGGITCGPGTECCSMVRFTCPAGGQYSVLWGANVSTMRASTSCTVDSREL